MRGGTPPSAAAACPPSRIVVEGRTYQELGDLPLTEEAVAALEQYGEVAEASAGLATNLTDPADRTVWGIPGHDPEKFLWGTSVNLRGTDSFTLWAVENCPCHPDVCDFVDLGAVVESIPVLEACTAGSSGLPQADRWRPWSAVDSGVSE